MLEPGAAGTMPGELEELGSWKQEAVGGKRGDIGRC